MHLKNIFYYYYYDAFLKMSVGLNTFPERTIYEHLVSRNFIFPPLKHDDYNPPIPISFWLVCCITAGSLLSATYSFNLFFLSLLNVFSYIKPLLIVAYIRLKGCLMTNKVNNVPLINKPAGWKYIFSALHSDLVLQINGCFISCICHRRPYI